MRASNPKDNRKHTRVTLELAAELILDNRTRISGKIKNISFSGAYLLCQHTGDIAAGATGHLKILLQSASSQSAIDFACKVVRTDPSGTGMKFLLTDLAGYQQFKTMMIYNSSDPDYLLAELEKNPGLEISED